MPFTSPITRARVAARSHTPHRRSLLVAPLTALAVSVFDGNFTVVNAALLAVTVAATPALRGLDRRRDVGRSLPRQE